MKHLLLVLFILAIPLSAFAQGSNFRTLETFRSEDGAFIAILPDDWVAQGSREEGLSIANNEETLAALLDETDAPLESGQVAISITTFDTEELLTTLVLDTEATEVDMLNGLIASILAEGTERPTLSEAEEVKFGNQPAATSAGTWDANTDATLYLHEIVPGTTALSVVVVPTGEIEGSDGDAKSAILSVGFSLDLTETYIRRDRTISFSYPADLNVSDIDFARVSTYDEIPAMYESGDMAFTVVNMTEYCGCMIAQDLDTALYNFELSLLEPGDEIKGTYILLVNDTDEVRLIIAGNSDGGRNEGGTMVMEKDGTIWGVIYLAAPGMSNPLIATALNILYTIE